MWFTLLNRLLFLQHFLILVFVGSLAFQVNAGEFSAQLPESLGKWYKPENKRQVWLHTMFGMRRELQAVQEYADEGDMTGIRKWSARLIKHYRSLPEMVPEWSEEVELDTASDLEKSVEQEDLAAIKSAARRLGRSCRGCHSDYRLLARLRYRTASFKGLEINDNGKVRKLSGFKKELIRTLNRIKISAVDSRWEKASSAVDSFMLKLDSLASTCSSCHEAEEPAERILGSATQAGLTQLKNAVDNNNLKQTGLSLGTTAVEVCARCHGVHRSLSEIQGQLFSRDM